jgi:hypothetical protein
MLVICLHGQDTALTIRHVGRSRRRCCRRCSRSSSSGFRRGPPPPRFATRSTSPATSTRYRTSPWRPGRRRSSARCWSAGVAAGPAQAAPEGGSNDRAVAPAVQEKPWQRFRPPAGTPGGSERRSEEISGHRSDTRAEIALSTEIRWWRRAARKLPNHSTRPPASAANPGRGRVAEGLGDQRA